MELGNYRMTVDLEGDERRNRNDQNTMYEIHKELIKLCF